MEYPGHLKSLYSETKIFNVLFSHLDIWYPNYKVNVSDHNIVIKIKLSDIYTGLMNILSQLEKELKNSGYNEPTILIRRNKIIINEI